MRVITTGIEINPWAVRLYTPEIIDLNFTHTDVYDVGTDLPVSLDFRGLLGTLRNKSAPYFESSEEVLEQFLKIEVHLSENSS